MAAPGDTGYPRLPIPFGESRWLRHLFLVLAVGLAWWGVSTGSWVALIFAGLGVSGWAKSVFTGP